MDIEYSINPLFKNKVQKDIHWIQNRTFIKVRSNLDTLLKFIQSGYGFGPVYCDKYYYSRNFKSGYNISSETRKSVHFVKSDFAIVDIDKELTIQQICNNKKLLNIISILYPTFNFDINNNPYRFRLISRLETPIYDIDKYEKLLKGFSLLCKQEPSQASSANTCFYGNNKADCKKYSFVDPDKYLSDDMVDKIIDYWINSDKYKRSKKRGSSPPSKQTRIVVTASSGPKQRVIRPELRATYEVLFPDSVVDGVVLGQVQGHISGIHCPFGQYHRNNDANPSAWIDQDKNGRVFVGCGSEGINRFVVPETYESKSANSLSIFNIIQTNKRYISPIIPQKKLTIIKSFKGSGKTTSLKQTIQWARSNNFNVLMLSHLRSLALSLSKDLGLNCYLTSNYKSVNCATRHYIINPHSLFNQTLNIQSINYDVLIFEEFESLLLQIINDTLEDKVSAREILDYIAHLIDNAKYVILIDADIGFLTAKFLELLQINDGDVDLISNTFAQPKRDVYLCVNQYQLIDMMRKRINKSKPFIFVSNEKKFQEEFYLSLRTTRKPGLKILLINSDTITNQECKDFIQNPKNEAVKYDVLMYNSSLSTGVSIDLDINHFECIFGYFTNSIFRNQTTTYLQNFQILSRYRNIVPWYLFISNALVNKKVNTNNYANFQLNRREYKVHNGIVDEYLKFYNHNILNYYSIHRSYLHDNGFNCTILYPTPLEAKKGFVYGYFSRKSFLYQIRKYFLTKPEERKNLKIKPPLSREALKLLLPIFKSLQFNLSNLTFGKGFLLETELKNFRRYISNNYYRFNNHLLPVYNPGIVFDKDLLDMDDLENNLQIEYLLYFFNLINIELDLKLIKHYGTHIYRFSLPS